MSSHNQTVLRPYQRRWANDPARFAIAVKSAQIGFSTATAARYVDKCLSRERHTVIFLSRSERQSLELAEKAKTWLDGYQGVIADFFPNEHVRLGDAEVLQHEIRFPNRSRIIALPANPDTARGYTGDIVLDEFAFHRDSEAIFKAAFRQTTLGYEMRVLSTPNGQQGKFYELAKKLGLDLGLRPPRQPVGATRRVAPTPDATGWSGHWCDIYLAAEEGCPIAVEETRNACDQETWLQEYCCQFVSQAAQWFAADLYDRCTSVEAGVDFPIGAPLVGARVAEARGMAGDLGGHKGRHYYAGWDIARKRDLSVIWICELVGDVTWTRGVIEMRNTATPEQVKQARALLPYLRRMNIDQSGMGLAIAEQLQHEFPGKVEGLLFTAPLKERLAVLGKRRAEEGKVRLPDVYEIKNSFTSMKKSVNSLGQARFDTEHDAKYGHGDHWWAYCLAEAAAEQRAHSLSEGFHGMLPRPAMMQPLECMSMF